MEAINPRESTGFLVGRVAHHLKLRVQDFLDEAGIPMSAEEISILTMLAHLDAPERMKPLAEMLGRDATTLSRQIDGLENAGLVQRAPCPDDGRAVLVSVTAPGMKLAQRTLPMTIALRQRAMHGVSKADEKVVVGALKQMLSNLVG
ncbi:MAG: MarR family transcriptional regulator [Gemmatimonadota bacterium]|nr:MAG: MarR family transcriptional regulator [Gemmatimonadota bacterium]